MGSTFHLNTRTAPVDIRVPFNTTSQAVQASALPSVCVHCGGKPEGSTVRLGVPYLPRAGSGGNAPLHRGLPAVHVALPVCEACRGRGGSGISAVPDGRGWGLLGGVSAGFATAVAQMLE